jgi:cytochrome P450
MVGPVDDLMEIWENAAKEGKVVDVASDFMKLTTEIAAKAMFSTNMGTLKDEITNNITIVNHFVMNKVSTPFRIPVWVPAPSNLNFKKALKKLDVIIYNLIENRRKSIKMPHDLLTMLIEAEDEETGERMNDEQLRDELMTLFLAGSETSSNALAWTVYLLSQNPQIAQQLYEEVKKELGGETPTAENIMRLKYTSMVILEAMRLYPPAWIIGREPLEDDEINGVRIKKGSQVYISTFVIHRSPHFYPDPLKFDPMRFSPEKVKARPKFSYLPFGAGPRLCIGNNFAMMEVTIALAVIAQKNLNFELKNKDVAMDPLVTLRPKEGLMMKISR